MPAWRLLTQVEILSEHRLPLPRRIARHVCHEAASGRMTHWHIDRETSTVVLSDATLADPRYTVLGMEQTPEGVGYIRPSIGIQEDAALTLTEGALVNYLAHEEMYDNEDVNSVYVIDQQWLLDALNDEASVLNDLIAQTPH